MFKKSNETGSIERPVARSRTPSVLGPTVKFKGGELSADEDLVIQGTVEGSIAHQSHNLIIGKSGRVKANIRALVITVEGTVEGDIHGDEAVIIKSTAHVIGNVSSPRVAVEDGATFTGNLRTVTQGAQESSGKPVSALAGSAGVRARRNLTDELEAS